MKTILLIDIGSTYTKLTLVDPSAGEVVGTAKAFTTVSSDVNVGLNNALKKLHDEFDFEVTESYASSSAAGGLKMITCGLVPELTVKAARSAALCAGAKLIGSYAFKLTEEESIEIGNIAPDIVLLTGGTDAGNEEVILHNARVLAGISVDFPVVVAGNGKASARVKKILQEGGKEVYVSENVMPRFEELNIRPAQEAIRDIFLKRIVRAKGITKIQTLIDGILMPTPSAVLQAATVLSKGTKTISGIGDLLLIDIGGATTDVYSVSSGKPSGANVLLKGLKEPYEKRSVEGDLGVRYTAQSTVSASGEDFSELCDLDDEEINEHLNKIKNNPEILADNKKAQAFDTALAMVCAEKAVSRHVGRIEKVYTLNGIAEVQTGKDLTGVKYVIGTGGPIVHNPNAEKILRKAFYDMKEPDALKPVKSKCALDKRYIFAAMGLLSIKYPDLALKIMLDNMLYY